MWANALKWTGVANFTVLLMIRLGSIWSFLFHNSLLLNIILFYSWDGFKTWDKFLQQQHVFLKIYVYINANLQEQLRVYGARGVLFDFYLE